MPNVKEEDSDGRGGLISMVAQHDRSIAIVRVSMREGSIPPLTDVSTLWTALQLSAETTLTDGLSVPREDLNCTVQRAAKDRFLVAYPARHVGRFSLILSASITWSDVSPPPATSGAAIQILPGCQDTKKTQISNISRIVENRKHGISNISRIGNVKLNIAIHL